LSALAPDPIAVSAKTGEHVEALYDRIHGELPDYQRERLVLPMTDETMSVVSWIHDNAEVEDVMYGDQVVVEFEARPAIVEQSRAKAGQLIEASA
jgi:GTP-binding protein HflX